MVKHMRYGEFVDWCNRRAANGEWGANEAIKMYCYIWKLFVKKPILEKRGSVAKLLCTGYYF